MQRYITHGAAFLAGAIIFHLIPMFYRMGNDLPEAERPRQVALNVCEGDSYRVRRIVDGDTIVLANGLHVRYAGINTPEVGRYVRDSAPLADRARERNAEWVEGKRVRLTFAKDALDAHGRLVAHVTAIDDAGGELEVGDALLREGLGRALGLGLPSEDFERLKGIQEQARKKKTGIWGLKHPLEAGNPEGFEYCATSKSGIFHRVACSTARRIPAANFKGYRTLVEALASGRKGCSRCCDSSHDRSGSTNAKPALSEAR